MFCLVALSFRVNKLTSSRLQHSGELLPRPLSAQLLILCIYVYIYTPSGQLLTAFILSLQSGAVNKAYVKIIRKYINNDEINKDIY